MTDAALIAAAQILAVAATVAVDLLLTGGFGLVMPVVAGGIAGSVAMFILGSRRTGWPDRPAIYRAAWISAGVHWGVGALAYAALYFADPTGYEFGPRGLLLAAPVIGLLPGGAALVLTLCAGDGVRTALGVEEPTP